MVLSQEVTSAPPDGQFVSPQGLKMLFWVVAVAMFSVSSSVSVPFNGLPGALKFNEHR